MFPKLWREGKFIAWTSLFIKQQRMKINLISNPKVLKKRTKQT